MNSQYNRGLHYLTLLTALLSLALIGLGSYISSADYGLAIPDWPTSLGKLVPDQLAGGIFYSYLHRVLAAAVGLLTLLLGLYVYTRDQRPLAQKMGLAAAGLILLQIVLGGLGVLSYFPSVLKIFHAALAHLFFAVAAALVALYSPLWTRKAEGSGWDAKMARRTRGLAAMVLLQVFVGSVVRHADVKGLYTASLMLHIVLALGVLVSGVTTGFAIVKAAREAVLRIVGVLTGLLVLLQVLVGIGVLVAPPVDAAGQITRGYISQSIIHVTAGALLVGWSVYLALIARGRSAVSTG